MTRPTLHRNPVRFSTRIEKPLNDALMELAEIRGLSKTLLIESMIGEAVLKARPEIEKYRQWKAEREEKNKALESAFTRLLGATCKIVLSD